MIYLFGDSYVDENYGNESWQWTRLLSQHYNVTNLGLIGTGPTYAINKLCDLIQTKKIDKDKDILMFFVPEFFRIDFAYFKNPQDQVFSYSVKNHSLYKLFDKNYNNEKQQWQEKWWRYYQLHNNNDVIDVVKIFSLINSYSFYFKKTLIVNTDKDFKNYKKFVKNVVISDDIHFPLDINLGDISRQEYDGKDIKHGRDKRANHIGENNHRIMFELLKNWITNDTPLTNIFVK